MIRTHRNNFDVLRLMFASLVVYSHSFALLGIPEPTIWGSSFGNLAVNGFFVISGYLICQSYLADSRIVSFAFGRFLRIVPGLIAALSVTRLIADRCNGFHNNPIPDIANGPIWTLTWEVLCYAAVPVMGAIGALSVSSLPGFFAAAWLTYMANIESTSSFFLVIAPLFLQFLSGAFIRLAEDQIHMKSLAAMSLVVLLLTAYVPAFRHLSLFVRSHIVFLWGIDLSDQQVMRALFLASFPTAVIFGANHVRMLLSVRHDISYGIYIYGWPIGQCLVFIQGTAIHPLAFFTETMAVTTLLAFASWLLIERPALLLKRVMRNRPSPTG